MALPRLKPNTDLASAVDDGAIFFVDSDAFCTAQMLKRCTFEVEADFFGNHSCASEERDIL